MCIPSSPSWHLQPTKEESAADILCCICSTGVLVTFLWTSRCTHAHFLLMHGGLPSDAEVP